jgi:chemotaxis protein MotA
MTMGTDNPHEMEALIDEDIELHKHESAAVAHAVTAMSDGLPAFGIVAAVLGVIVTMSYITEPPEVLGSLIGAALVGTFLGVLLAYGLIGLIGAALVGTFLGVLLAYGLIGLIGKSLEAYGEADLQYYKCMKAGLLAHMAGHAPAVSVEFARKTLMHHERPTFQKLEEAVQEAPQIS